MTWCVPPRFVVIVPRDPADNDRSRLIDSTSGFQSGQDSGCDHTCHTASGLAGDSIAHSWKAISPPGRRFGFRRTDFHSSRHLGNVDLQPLDLPIFGDAVIEAAHRRTSRAR